MSRPSPWRRLWRDLHRARWALLMGALVAALGELLIRFDGGGDATLVSLLDVVLIVVPLLGLVAGTMQLHRAREMTALLLAQPVTRGRLFASLYLGALLPLAAALGLGVIAPFAWHGLLGDGIGWRVLAMAGAAVALAATSTALAFVLAMHLGDRTVALGVALAVWLTAAVLWDGVVLLVLMLRGDGGVAWPLLAMLACNPIDLARVLLLLGTDASALFGATGATVQHVLGTGVGRAALAGLLGFWIVAPLVLAARRFARKDF